MGGVRWAAGPEGLLRWGVTVGAGSLRQVLIWSWGHTDSSVAARARAYRT